MAGTEKKKTCKTSFSYTACRETQIAKLKHFGDLFLFVFLDVAFGIIDHLNSQLFSDELRSQRSLNKIISEFHACMVRFVFAKYFDMYLSVTRQLNYYGKRNLREVIPFVFSSVYDLSRLRY